MAEVLTSDMVWLTVAAMSSGMDFSGRSGMAARVETQRSGYNVPWQVEWAIWRWEWMWRFGDFVGIGEDLRRGRERNRRRERDEIGMR